MCVVLISYIFINILNNPDVIQILKSLYPYPHYQPNFYSQVFARFDSEIRLLRGILIDHLVKYALARKGVGELS